MNNTQYIESIIKTALSNGMTMEDIAKADPSELTKAHLHCQLKAIDTAGKDALKAS